MTSGLWNFRISRLQTFRTSELWHFRTSGLYNFHTSGLQNFRSSEFQNFRTSEFQNFRTSRLQGSGCQNLRTSGLGFVGQWLPLEYGEQLCEFRESLHTGRGLLECHRTTAATRAGLWTHLEEPSDGAGWSSSVAASSGSSSRNQIQLVYEVMTTRRTSPGSLGVGAGLRIWVQWLHETSR